MRQYYLVGATSCFNISASAGAGIQTLRLLTTCPNVFPRSLAGCPFLAEQIETQASPNRALLYEF
jgi:hypothetical protein